MDSPQGSDLQCIARPSWSQRLRSARNELSLRVGRFIRFSRGPVLERPCLRLPSQPAACAARIACLASRYGIAFETRLGARSSLDNYAYLDLMDRAFAAHAMPPPRGLEAADVGSGSFWYVAALQAFFAPRRLEGYEVEGFRRYLNGRTRLDSAQGYAQPWPQTRYHVTDYRQVRQTAALVTCWFPFVSAEPLLSWGLPLNLLKPQELFQQINCNLTADGRFFMVNHGPTEAQVAAGLAKSAGLRLLWVWPESDPLLRRSQKPVASYWQR